MIGENLRQFWQYTGFANFEWTYLLMICIGLIFIYLAIKKEWEPMLLVPIGFGIIIGNIPLFPGLSVGIYEEGSVLNILYYGVIKGFYPPLIFLGIGAPDLQSQAAAHRSRCPAGYLRSLHSGPRPRVLPR